MKKNILKLFIGVLLFSISIIRVNAATTSTYYVWNVGDNYYYHKITGLERTEGTNVPTNYYKLSDMVADNNNEVTYELGQEGRFYLTNKFEEVIANGPYANANELYEALENADAGIDPCGAKNSLNTVQTNGDRDFRLIIYNDSLDGYAGIDVGVPNDYSYFPSFWDPMFHTSVFDLTDGKTSSKPVIVESYLLEDTITITNDEVSGIIKSISAVDVPDKAVSISNRDGLFTIKFSSNYFDRVVFKVKLIDGRSYYVMIARIALQVHDNLMPGMAKKDRRVIATLYYPSRKSYKDYEVVAHIMYSNNSEVLKTLKAIDAKDTYFDDNLGEWQTIDLGKEYDGGTNLKASSYEVDASKDIDEITYTITNSGSTSSKYSGTFSGSGKGTTWSSKTRGLVF